MHSLVLISHVLACCMCVDFFLHGIEIRVRSLLVFVIIGDYFPCFFCFMLCFLCGSIISVWGGVQLAICPLPFYESFFFLLSLFSFFSSSYLCVCVCMHVCVRACVHQCVIYFLTHEYLCSVIIIQ